MSNKEYRDNWERIFRRDPRKLDLTGFKGSHYTVLGPAPNKGKRTRWFCLCDCGKEFTSGTETIRRKRSPLQSCGCVRNNAININHNPQRTSWNNLINQYRQKAKNRGLEWDLSVAEALDIFQQPCAYCGSPPQTRHNVFITQAGKYRGRLSTAHADQGWIVFNGIDRQDNTVGYILSNVVACCPICNYAKRNLSLEEFLAWIHRLHAFWSQKEIT